jgi:hypothetical protein
MLDVVRIRQQILGILFVSGLGYFVSASRAYLLFRSMLRLHDYERAKSILKISSRRYTISPDVDSMRCTLAIRDGSLNYGMALLNASIAKGDQRAIELLLFRKGVRPRDLAACLNVLRAIADHEKVEHTLRCYALIAIAYQVLRTGDRQQARDVRLQINEWIAKIRDHPDVYSCQQPNRKNTTKLFVSLCTTGYHLSMMLDHIDDCFLYWHEASTLLARIDYSRINPGAGLRMTSNLSRCLALGALLAPPVEHEALSRRLQAFDRLRQSVQVHCLEQDQSTSRFYDENRPQENHLMLLDSLQEACRDLMSQELAIQAQARQRYAKLINHSSSSAIREVILNWFSRHPSSLPLDHSIAMMDRE